MLFHILLSLAALLVADAKEPKRPVWSPVYSTRVEAFSDHGLYSSRHIWVDKVHNRTRTDYWNGHEQCVFEYDQDVMDWPLVHRVFPVTTEEHLNVRKCFLLEDYSVLLYTGTLFTLPPMDKFNYDGDERMNDQDASRWKTFDTWNYPLKGSDEVTIWVVEKKGVSIPVRIYVNLKYDDIGLKVDFYMNFYDFDTSNIDSEVWNIGAGMNCKYAVGSDVKKDSNLINKMTNPIGSRKENVSSDFDDYFRHLENNYLYGLMNADRNYQFTPESLRNEEMDIKQDSTSSKALPFPYTSDEIKQLSAKLPKHFDWRMYGNVTPVKRSMRGENYAQAAADVVEGALFLKSGRKSRTTLSAQAIVDCSWGFGNRGTEGGSMESSYEWMKVHGMPSASKYPHTGLNDNCYVDNVEKETRIKDYYSVPANDENALKLAIVNHGPVVVLYDGWNIVLHYKNGVYNDTTTCRNGPGSWNTAGLAVGYDTLDGEDYWIVKSTYGSFFFVDGYIPIAIANNTCGVLNSPTYVTVE